MYALLRMASRRLLNSKKAMYWEEKESSVLQCATASQGASKQGTSLLQAPSQPSSPAGPQPHCSMNSHRQTRPHLHMPF